MNWLKLALTSSVGKKFVIGLTGLLLCGFLVTHLAGNLLLLVGADAYNEYAHALHGQGALLLVAEIGLLLLFLCHIYLAFVTTRENRAARGAIRYARRNSKIEDKTVDAKISPMNWMFVSGAVVLGFVLVHLYDFRFEMRGDIDYSGTAELHGEQVADAYSKAVQILASPFTKAAYLIGCLFLGWHLGHGVASAFQSLGINHPKWNPLIRCAGIVFAIVIASGFAIFPLYFS